MYAHEPPEYFPSLVFFAQMAAVDRFVVDDGLQYSRQSFQNRARLRTPDGIQWITVPLTGGQFGRSIADTEIDHSQNWVTRHLKALRFNYGSAPFYGHYLPALEEILRRDSARLGELTRALVACLHAQLRLTSRLVFTSEPHAGAGAERRVFDLTAGPESARIRLVRTSMSADDGDADRTEILNFTCPEYRQNFPGFAPDLSVLDLLFNLGPDAAHILRAATWAAIPLYGS